MKTKLILLFIVLMTARLAAEEGLIPTPDGTHLFYQKLGNGPQTVIIPLGFLLYKDFKYLANDHRTVIFYDLRNRGRSDSISDLSKISLQNDVDDLETIRKFFKVERFTPIGFSYLGKMVVLYAMKYPGHAARIVQLDPVAMKLGTKFPPGLQNDETNAEIDKQRQKVRGAQKQGLDEKQPKEYCEIEWRLSQLELVGDPANAGKVEGNVCQYKNEWPVNLAKHFQSLMTSDIKLEIPKADVAALKIPVLTIHGTKDRNAPYGGGREWAATLPDARLITVPGAAHESWADAPNLIFTAIDEFLNGNWPAKAERLAEE